MRAATVKVAFAEVGRTQLALTPFITTQLKFGKKFLRYDASICGDAVGGIDRNLEAWGASFRLPLYPDCNTENDFGPTPM